MTFLNDFKTQALNFSSISRVNKKRERERESLVFACSLLREKNLVSLLFALEPSPSSSTCLDCDDD